MKNTGMKEICFNPKIGISKKKLIGSPKPKSVYLKMISDLDPDSSLGFSVYQNPKDLPKKSLCRIKAGRKLHIPSWGSNNLSSNVSWVNGVSYCCVGTLQCQSNFSDGKIFFSGNLRLGEISWFTKMVPFTPPLPATVITRIIIFLVWGDPYRNLKPCHLHPGWAVRSYLNQANPKFCGSLTTSSRPPNTFAWATVAEESSEERLAEERQVRESQTQGLEDRGIYVCGSMVGCWCWFDRKIYL